MPDKTPAHPSRGPSSAGDAEASGRAATGLDLAAAEAEAEAAQAAAAAAAAEADAAAARARAARMRRDSEIGEQPAGYTAPTVTLTQEYGEASALDAQPGSATRTPRSRGKIALAAAGVLVIGASLAATGWMTYQHSQTESDRKQAAEYEAAAKQGIVTLTSLDFNNADANVQAVLDSSTGEFRDDFEKRKDDFTKVIQQSQVATQGEVNATAVESMTDDSAVVLVSSTSKVTNNAGAQQEPRVWRLSVTVARDGDQIKMSKVDFVP